MTATRIGLLFLMMTFQADSWATSRIETIKHGVRPVLPKHCEISGQFKKPFRNNTRVYWEISIDSAKSLAGGKCPGGRTLHLLVWGAEWSRLTRQFVYPDYISPPPENANIRVRIEKRSIQDTTDKKKFNDWMIIDWQNGLEVQ